MLLLPQLLHSDSEFINISILFPFIAPPQSSATNLLPNLGMYTLVPYGITLASTAIVPHLGVVPVAPLVCPL